MENEKITNNTEDQSTIVVYDQTSKATRIELMSGQAQYPRRYTRGCNVLVFVVDTHS